MTVAARDFGVAYRTLVARSKGVKSRLDYRAETHLLTKTEEESLREEIFEMDLRGAAPYPIEVREMADSLLALRGEVPVKEVGENWVYNFIKREKELTTRYTKRYNYKRAKCEDRNVIKGWFDRFQSIMERYGIVTDDIYNFDETGFTMGATEIAKVVTSKKFRGRRDTIQPGNREWVTAIECSNATGFVLPPFVIFKGKGYIESWGDGLPNDWRFEVSPKGWTSDTIGLHWVENHFIPLTTRRTKGLYRLLILDGHGSHKTSEFNEICKKNNTITLCMPPHSSHLSQPLDIGCFAV